MDMHARKLAVALLPLAFVLLPGCKKSAHSGSADSGKRLVGLVSDVAGRGDQSFNDSALRGLERWAGGVVFTGNGYRKETSKELSASIPARFADLHIHPLAVRPLVLQSSSQEDYEPNLQLLVDRGTQLTIATGFMLANAVAAVAKRNPKSRFLLIDSRLRDAKGHAYTLPNVRTITFREEEGSYLAGALAGLVTQTGRVGFVGGMQIPLIRKFEAGFRAGVHATNPKAQVLVNYTGSFDRVSDGKQVGQDMVAKKADVIFHAAGSCGLGVIDAVKEARATGKNAWVIGVDSDQWHLAPKAVLTSMVKHVDLAVYDTVRDLTAHHFTAESLSLGLKERGVALAPVRVDFPHKKEILAKVAAIRARIIAGKVTVPTTVAALGVAR